MTFSRVLTDKQKVALFDYMVAQYNRDLNDFADTYRYGSRYETADYAHDDNIVGCASYTPLLAEITELLGCLSDFNFPVNPDNSIVALLEKLQHETPQERINRITEEFDAWKKDLDAKMKNTFPFLKEE